MSRSKNIKPGLFKNEILGDADPIYTLLFAGLWTLADREGRLENRPKRIKAELFPYRSMLDPCIGLDWLKHNSFITMYEIEGKKYIQIKKWRKHQSPHHKEVKSVIPPIPDDYIYEEYQANQEDSQAQVMHESSTSHEQVNKSASSPLIPDSLNLIPDSLNPIETLDQNHDELFEMFWSSGIRKVNKKKARSLFLKLIAKEKDKEHFTRSICNDIYLRIMAKQMGFSEMHPTTYINGERWNDEIIKDKSLWECTNENNQGSTTARRPSLIDRVKENGKQFLREKGIEPDRGQEDEYLGGETLDQAGCDVR